MAKTNPTLRPHKAGASRKNVGTCMLGEQSKAGKSGTRSEQLITMMRTRQGATAQELASAIGWQVHSIRGFIAGNLKKRDDLEVSAAKIDGLTRYRVRTRKGVAA